jgi:hypothetical protein
MDNWQQKHRDKKLLFLTTDQFDLEVFMDAQERLENTKEEFDIIVKERITNYRVYHGMEALGVRDNFGEIITGDYIWDIISRKSGYDVKIEYERDKVRLIYGHNYEARNFLERHYIIEVSSDIISRDWFRVLNVHTFVNREDLKRAKMLNIK